MPGCWKKSSAFIVGPGRKFRQLVLKGLRGSKAFCFSDFFFKLKDNCFTDFSCFLPNVPQRLLVQFSRSVVSGSLPDGLQHTRPPCPSPTPRAYSNSCSLSRWWNPNISSCHALLLLTLIFPNIRVFSNESVLCIRWPKDWSFSFSLSPSVEYSGLISFRIDWFDLLTV